MKKRSSSNISQFEAFPAGKEAKHLLSAVLKKIDKTQKINMAEVCRVWGKVLGEKYASMTQVLEFHEGILTIKIDSAPLFSILKVSEQAKLEKEMRERLPLLKLKKINFRR